MRVGLPLSKNVLTPLTKSILVPLEWTATASTVDTAIHKKIYGSRIILLIISNKVIMEIVKHLEGFGLLNIIKVVSKTIKNEAKNQNAIVFKCH